MSKLSKYKPLIPIAKSGTSEVVKFKHKFDISLAELAELALEYSGSAQVARGFLLNLRTDAKDYETYFKLSTLRKFDSNNRQNAFNILNTIMITYDGLSSYIDDDQYWDDIKKHYIEVINE